MTLPRIALIAATLTCALGADARAQSPATGPVLTALTGSTLTIRGSTTIGAKWHCSTDAVTSNALLADDSSGTHVKQVDVQVLVSALRCQSAPMERAMRKAMRAERDPASAILGRFAAFTDAAPDSAQLDGTLIVAGVQRAVWVSAVVSPETDGTRRVRTTVPLLLSQFQITPPRVLFGAVRARDAIVVEVDLRFPADLRVADSTRPPGRK